jgi:hypothetical protein
MCGFAWAEQGVWHALPETLVELGLTDNYALSALS